jgi:hypothetical protein
MAETTPVRPKRKKTPSSFIETVHKYLKETPEASRSYKSDGKEISHHFKVCSLGFNERFVQVFKASIILISICDELFLCR